MRRAFARTAIAGMLVALAGCSVVQAPERPNWNVFALERSAPGSTPAAVPGPVAIVALPESGAGYGTPRMAYSRADGRIEYFAENRWADTPGRMLVPLFQDALTRTGAFGAVATMPTRAAGDVLIESNVLVFRLEPEAAEPNFHLMLAVTVVDHRAPTGARTQVFDVTEPLGVGGPADGVAAARRAVARGLEEAAAFCADGVRTEAP